MMHWPALQDNHEQSHQALPDGNSRQFVSLNLRQACDITCDKLMSEVVPYGKGGISVKYWHFRARVGVEVLYPSLTSLMYYSILAKGPSNYA